MAALVWAYLPAALISAFLPSRMGRIADRLGRRGPMIAGLLVGALGSGLIPNLRSIVPLIVLWAVESLGYTALIPAERAFVADIAGEDTRGTSYGLYTFSLPQRRRTACGCVAGSGGVARTAVVGGVGVERLVSL